MPEVQASSTTFILVALDYSAASRTTSALSVKLAQHLRLDIHGLYVVDDTLTLESYGTNAVRELQTAPQARSRAELIKWFEGQGNLAVQWLQARCREAHVPMISEVRLGRISRTILSQAEQAALVVMGRQGHRHASEPYSLGANFRTVAHHLNRPLFSGTDETRSLQRLLLAYDGSKRARRALSWTVRLQQALAAKVDVVVALDGRMSTEERLQHFRSDIIQSGLDDYQIHFQEGQPAGAIVVAAESYDPDLILLGGYRHRGLWRWLNTSTVDKVLEHTRRPVLIA
jgi:nucleotide-binding universal stress UspA family protein